MKKELIYFTYRCSKAGEYAHPTITINHAWNGEPRSLDSEVMVLTSQTHFTGENDDHDLYRPNTWRPPYAIRINIELDYARHLPLKLLKDLFAAYTHRDVLRVLRKHKIYRWVRCADGDLVPRYFASKSTLWLEARSSGFDLVKP